MVVGLQGVENGRFQLPMLFMPLGGAAMEVTNGRFPLLLPQSLPQQLPKQMVIPIPASLVVEGDKEEVVGFEVVKQLMTGG